MIFSSLRTFRIITSTFTCVIAIRKDYQIENTKTVEDNSTLIPKSVAMYSTVHLQLKLIAIALKLKNYSDFFLNLLIDNYLGK